MGYRVQKLIGPVDCREELAKFLAGFVREGGLLKPKPGDDSAPMWSKRFGWWWDDNPFCHSDSPRGFILWDKSDRIVGFNGLIPFEYEVDGEMVPTLVTSTFFVHPDHRSAVMGLLSKQRALARQYHVIDGSPSPEMRRLLGRLGYEKSGERYQYFFPLRGLGGEMSRSVLRPFGLSFPLPEAATDSGEYIATSPDEIESIPILSDGKLRRRITVESLSWLCRIGTEERGFFGLCDRYGTLISYGIGLYKRRCGIDACLLLDSVDFSTERNGFARLLGRLTDPDESASLRQGTKLVSWSVLGEAERPARGFRRESLLYYRLPGNRPPVEKSCVPFEGDLPLL